MRSVPNKVAEALLESIGDSLLTTITAIRTEYKNANKRFSGTGLLLVDSGARIYCLTANHVVSPKRRSNPVKAGVVRHYHSQFLEQGGKYESFAFRSKFYKSEGADLAMLESCLSETEIGRQYEGRVMTSGSLMAAGSIEIHSNDIFVMAGLPTDKLSEIPVTRESNHGALFGFFYADQGSSSEASESCYEVPFSGEISPLGMSGSPVWLIRATSNVDAPLDHAYVTSTPSSKQEINAAFMGLAVQYKAQTRKIVIVKPGVCAEFAKSAWPVMPTIRLPEENLWIEQNL